MHLVLRIFVTQMAKHVKNSQKLRITKINKLFTYRIFLNITRLRIIEIIFLIVNFNKLLNFPTMRLTLIKACLTDQFQN